ncbi:glycosyltransferase [Ureibacillus sp. FSL W7-1570]|uniref:glycosyltransferase n=1 Tax=Ureibacillus sp. FSL W7-1570 TaxID=2954593 RepID=UPI003159D228
MKLRKVYNYDKNDFILIYVAELSYRKNQNMIISAVGLLKNKIPNLKVLFVGDGDYLENYKEIVKKKGVEEIIDFLGYRTDVPDLMKMSDVAISSSRQEGLPVNVMEAMATGLPLVVTNCRGNRDLVSNNENGYVIDLDKIDDFANAIFKLYTVPDKRQIFGKNSTRLVKKYSLDNVCKEMLKIYSDFLNE